MRICLILIIFQFSSGQAFLGKVYNNIVVSNDSNEEDSLVASSAQTRQGDGGCHGGRGGGGGGGCSGGRGKSGAGGPSNLGKDIVVTTNGPKAKIIVRKSKGSKKSVGTGSACSACCNQAQQGPPKVVYVPFCPHQMAGSFPVPSYEPFHQSSPLPSSSLNYPYSEQSSRQSTMYQPQSRALSPPGTHHHSFDVEPMMASSAQPSPQFHRPTFQFPPPSLHPNPTIPFSSSYPSMPSNMQFAPFHHSSPTLLPPPVPFQYIPNASVYPPSQHSHHSSQHSHPPSPQPPSFDSTSSGSIRYPSPNPSSTSEASQYTAQIQSSPVSNSPSSDSHSRSYPDSHSKSYPDSHSQSYPDSHSQSYPDSTISQRYDRYKHKYPTSTAASAREEHEMKDDFEFGRRTSSSASTSRHDDDGPDYHTFESRHSVSLVDPFASFVAEHGHAKSPR